MSDGTPNPAMCPMWRGPFAYGHATATRIFCGFDTNGCFLELGVDETRRAANGTHTIRLPRRGRGEQEQHVEQRRRERRAPPRWNAAVGGRSRKPRHMTYGRAERRLPVDGRTGPGRAGMRGARRRL